ncbi:MAG: OmpH family outer membrane protein, partial [Saprospiraceae bacterium]
MRKFKYVFALLFVVMASTFSFGQKYGHINSGNLMVLLPEVAMSDSLLADYRDSLIGEGQKKAQALEAKVKDFLARRNSGELTPRQEQEEGGKLQQEEQQLGVFEQEVREKVQMKREELLSPLLERVND